VSGETEIHTGDGAKRVDLRADVAEIRECVVVVDDEVHVRAQGFVSAEPRRICPLGAPAER
jgi:hypothetical protein